MKNLARLFFVLCFSFSAMAQNPPSGVYKYAFYAPLPNGTFQLISMNTANALLVAAGAGHTTSTQPPTGMYKAAVYGLTPSGTFVPLSLDATGALIVSGGGGSSPPLLSGALATHVFNQGSGTDLADALTARPGAVGQCPCCIRGGGGRRYTISNPQAAFTLSIVGGTNQPINGLTTPIAIASNSTVTIHDVANPKAVSGCHWAM